MSETNPILASKKDWDKWIDMIQFVSNSSMHPLWDYINPDLHDTDAKKLIEPEYPGPLDVNREKEKVELLTEGENRKLRSLETTFPFKVKDYRSKLEHMSIIRSKIFFTLAASERHHITGLSDPREMLKALSRVFKPDRLAEANEVRAQWNLLCRGPTKYKAEEEWLREWCVVYRRAVVLGIGGFQDSTAPQLEFLNSIRNLENSFVRTWEMEIERRRSDIGFIELVQEFEKDRQRERTAPQGRSFKGSTESYATFRGKSDNRCVCGGPHATEQCRFLCENKRPPGWVAKSGVMRKVMDAVAKDTSGKLQSIIDQNKLPQQQQQQSQHQQPQREQPIPEMNFVASYSLTDGNNAVSPLDNSFLYDSASQCHVCNKRERFISFQSVDPTLPENTIGGVGGRIPILGKGDIRIFARPVTGNEAVPFVLNNVFYCPDNPVNLVSNRLAISAGLYWNQEEEECTPFGCYTALGCISSVCVQREKLACPGTTLKQRFE